MPPIEAFRDAESFYATLAHESAHWTKHATRLDRDLGGKQWGDEGMPARNSWPNSPVLFWPPI
jgi:antirestriction protein ArdC